MDTVIKMIQLVRYNVCAGFKYLKCMYSVCACMCAHLLIQPDIEIQREEGLASIMSYLDDCRVAASMLNYNVDRAEYVSHNGRVQPVARDSDDLTLTDVTAEPRFVIGNDVRFFYI